MSAYQRNKGHNFERWVARRFSETLGVECRRGWQRQQGHAQPDVIVPGLHVECKIGANPDPKKALEQATAACPKDSFPVAIWKVDRRKPQVTMSGKTFDYIMLRCLDRPKLLTVSLEEFLRLYGEYLDNG